MYFYVRLLSFISGIYTSFLKFFYIEEHFPSAFLLKTFNGLAVVVLLSRGSNWNTIDDSDEFYPFTPKKSRKDFELCRDAYATRETFLQLLNTVQAKSSSTLNRTSVKLSLL